MARKRKAPGSQPTLVEQKPKLIPKVEEEEETSDEESEEEEEVEEEEDSDEEEESSSDEEEEESEEESEGEDDESSDESDETSKREALRELLEPFGKSQLIGLLKEAVTNNPKLLSKIVEKVNSDPTHRNIFVYGLGWDATTEQILSVFKVFGEIEDCKVITDKNTGRAKGYAFVLFKTRSASRKALKVPQKRIGSRMVTCQLAATGPSSSGAGAAAVAPETGSLKVYVGNVGPQINPEKLKAFFRRFGEIEEGPIGLDPTTNKFKGFAVITYKTLEGYKKAIEEPIRVFENCQLHCKKYLENPNKNSALASGSAGNATPTPAATDVSYGNLGVNAGMLGANLNASGLFMAPNPGTGLAGNGMFAAGYGYNPSGLVAPALSTQAAAAGSANYGMGSFGPTVMGNYGSQAALSGLGAFQNTQTGQPSVGSIATTTTATRVPESGASSLMAFPSYYNR